MNIICVTQRPIQTLNLIYLLAVKNIFFNAIYFCELKKNNRLNFKDEGSVSWKALQYQCKILNIKFKKIKDINSKSFLKILDKDKPECMISFVVDTIFSKKTISKFKNGIFSSHGGIMPKYRGVDCNAWAVLNGEKFVGITLQKISSGIDNGKIFCVDKLKISKGRNLEELSKKLFYNYKLQAFCNVIEKLKNKKKLKFKKTSKKGRQYFSMHPNLLSTVKKKIK